MTSECTDNAGACCSGQQPGYRPVQRHSAARRTRRCRRSCHRGRRTFRRRPGPREQDLHRHSRWTRDSALPFQRGHRTHPGFRPTGHPGRLRRERRPRGPGLLHRRPRRCRPGAPPAAVQAGPVAHEEGLHRCAACGRLLRRDRRPRRGRRRAGRRACRRRARLRNHHRHRHRHRRAQRHQAHRGRHRLPHRHRTHLYGSGCPRGRREGSRRRPAGRNAGFRWSHPAARLGHRRSRRRDLRRRR